MCVLKEAMMNKGLCKGTCDHHKKKKAVMTVFETNVMVAQKQPANSNYCQDKKNCTTACPVLGNPERCKLVA